MRISANTTGLISIYNLLGQSIVTGLVSPTEHRSINVANIPTGVYIVRVTNNSGNSSAKRVILLR